MRTLIRYTILNQDGQPVIRAVRVVYPSTARIAPPPQEVREQRPATERRELEARAAARQEHTPSGD